MAEYIYREQLLELINENCKYKTPTNEYTRGCNEVCDWAIKTIKNIPTADVQEVSHGHWILLRESEITGFNPEFAGRDPIGGYQCSNCKEVAIFDCNDEFVLSRYCPHCGAKMDGKCGD